jgi:hypothetical protein
VPCARVERGAVVDEGGWGEGTHGSCVRVMGLVGVDVVERTEGVERVAAPQDSTWRVVVGG